MFRRVFKNPKNFFFQISVVYLRAVIKRSEQKKNLGIFDSHRKIAQLKMTKKNLKFKNFSIFLQKAFNSHIGGKNSKN